MPPVDAPVPPPAAPARRGLGPRVSRFLHRHRRTRLGLLLGAPLGWLLVIYIGSLAALLLTSLYGIDDFTGNIVKTVSLDNFRELFTEPVYRQITLRTIGVAAAVTVICVVLAVPTAFYMAKVASPRARRWLLVGVLVPLWASYLVKAYAWRAILAGNNGVLEASVGWTPGYGRNALVIVLAYLWLPYMILPIHAGLERLPDSLLEASADLGARSFATFLRVVLPLLFPAIIAGSVFTFALSLGDYIAVGLVGGTTQLLGTVVFENFATNLPFAAAYSVVPVVIMLAYLAIVRRSGALENL